ncbi:glutathione S-transferase T3-like isoform X3 [Brassica napus]|uniref:glutathione S-transferase T3-like isoform X3 n=1 Tax=Brassica napus TaxID=3708 RepID=UPI002078BD1E|nr:glutathione S-transferase T3-like isoform X3 [Brassica napus]
MRFMVVESDDFGVVINQVSLVLITGQFVAALDGLAVWETVKEKTDNIEDKDPPKSSKIQERRRHLTLKTLFIKDVKPSLQVQSFQNLLNSQQPYPSVSDASAYGTGWPEEENEEADIVSDRKERRKWSPTEDKVAGLQKRDSTGCKSRWGKLNEGVCKFVGCYDAATKQKSSGQSEDDVLKLAHQIFFNDYKSKFTLEHAWLELRHDEKWCGDLASKNGVTSKRRKVDNQTGQSSTSVPCSLGEEDANGVEVRPAGVKAAKRLSKAAVRKANTEEAEGKVCVDLENMWDMRQKDFALREKVNNQKLLQRLRGKTEPLTEPEQALKNKLINDLLV